VTLFHAPRRWLAFQAECEIPTTTHQRKRIITIRPRGKPPIQSLGNTPELDDALAQWKKILQPHVPQAPLVGPLRLSASFMWQWREGEKGENRHAEGIWRDTKPDLSNLLKTMEDVMEELGFFVNDARIAAFGEVVKKWGPRGYLTVLLEELAG